MNIPDDLFKAILSMDAYNRGYNFGVEIENSSLGNASVVTDSEREFRASDATEDEITEAGEASFFAVAYSIGSGDSAETVISYRGTDDLSLSENPATGWPVGFGSPTAEQRLYDADDRFLGGSSSSEIFDVDDDLMWKGMAFCRKD